MAIIRGAFVLVILFLLASSVAADPVSDAAAGAVKQGMNSFAYGIGDSMIDMGGNGSNTDRGKTPELIFDMISYQIDPFSMDFVKDWWGTSLIFFVTVAIIYICAGGGFALISTLSPSLAQRLTWFESGSYNNNFEIKKWLSNVVLAVLFPIFTYFGLYVILELCYVVTALVTKTALNTVPPTAENIVTYLCMAFVYLLLSIIMGIRYIIIVAFCAGGLMLAALYLIPSLQNWVKHVFVYFLSVVFLQPLLVFVAAVGVMFLSEIPKEGFFFQVALYIGLMVLLLLIGLAMLLGFGPGSRMVERAL